MSSKRSTYLLQQKNKSKFWGLAELCQSQIFYLTIKSFRTIKLCGSKTIWTIFRQHAASIYGFVCQCLRLFRPKKFYATSKQGRRLRFGMLTVLLLTNIRIIKVEDNLWWKIAFGGRWPLVKDGLQWKTTFSGRQHSVENDLLWKTPFGGRRPLVEDDL